MFITAAGYLAAQPSGITIVLRARSSKVIEGRSAKLTAIAKRANGKPLAGAYLWPILNGRRWGAAEITDSSGSTSFKLPLPMRGRALLQMALKPDPSGFAHWIWGSITKENQTLYLSRSFSLSRKHKSAVLYMDADDTFTAYLNGRYIASGTSWKQVRRVNISPLLQTGSNLIMVKVHNGSGAAGLLAELQFTGKDGSRKLITDSSWRVMSTLPSGTSNRMERDGRPAVNIAIAGSGPWGMDIKGWPDLQAVSPFSTGQPIPANTPHSNILSIRVAPAPPSPPDPDPNHQVGMEWEPWFTPLNADWSTAEAIPILGRYSSYDPLAARQHALWLSRIGVNFLLVDWSNNLWGKTSWSDRGPGVEQLIRGFETMLNACAALKKVGERVPKMVLLLGLNNGPHTTTTAINEEMSWIYSHYVTNQKYKGLWEERNGKPLIVIFNGPGPSYTVNQAPIRTDQFEVRWMASQLQSGHFERFGYWSWMDGSDDPVATMHDGKPEALTITPAYFGDGGWLYPQARGRRNGYTYLKEWQDALKVKPRYLLICQWNEFAGQADGSGYGSKKDQFVDCYSPEFSNDIEPASRSLHAYRGNGGWGYTYMNFTRSAIQLYHQPIPRFTILAIAPPILVKDSSEQMKVDWCLLGKRTSDVTLWLDGRLIKNDLHESPVVVDISHIKPGIHRLTLKSGKSQAQTMFHLPVKMQSKQE